MKVPSNGISRIFVLMAFLCGSGLVRADWQTLDKFAAVVSDEVILESEIALEQALNASPFFQNRPHAPATREETLEKLIDRKLLLKEARRFIRISDEEVDEKVASYEKKAGGREKLAGILKGLHTDDLEFRKYVYNQLLMEKYIQKRIREFIQVLPADIDDYIEKHPGAVPNGAAQTPEQVKKLRDSIRVFLREKAVNEKLEQLVETLRSKASVSYPDAPDSGAGRHDDSP